MNKPSWGSNDSAKRLKNGVPAARGASRRELLRAIAAAGAGAVLPAAGLIAQTVRPLGGAKSGRIDVHHHMETKFVPGGADAHWTPAKSLEQIPIGDAG